MTLIGMEDLLFFLKKFISQMIYPLPFICAILIIGTILLIRNRENPFVKPIFITGVMLLLLSSYDPIPHFIAGTLENNYPTLRTPPSDINTIVVLGGGSTSDPKLPTSSQLSEQSLNRLIEGIAQFNQLDSARLIVTGGAVFDTITIAETQRRMAIKIGVDSSCIEMADSALTTEMEALAVREMVRENRIILVTSALHMTRSMALFRKVGFEPVPAPTNFRVKKGPFSPQDIFPNSENLVTLKKAVHEYFGILWSKLRGKA